MTKSKQKNDCVIVAISNGTGKSYDEIERALSVCAGQSRLIGRSGININVYHTYLKSLGWTRRETIPRRGQESITGIVRLYGGSKLYSHLVWIRNGRVFDIVSDGMMIADYQKRFRRKHINEIWLPPIALIEQEKVVDTNWLNDLGW